MAYLAKSLDSKGVQDKKMRKLQQQVEKQKQDQQLLLQKLEHLSNMQSLRTKKVIEKATSSTFAQKSDSNRIYESPGPTTSKVDEIIAMRTKEFQRSQAEKTAMIEYLTEERKKIMEARNRLREKHDMFRSIPSPVDEFILYLMGRPGFKAGNEVHMKLRTQLPSLRDVHSSESYTRKVVNDIPNAIERIWSLRDSLHEEYLRKKKPYAGELGIQSYEPWQIPDFLMVRRLVEEFVDDFVVKHIPPDSAIFKRDMKLQLLNEEDKDWYQTFQAFSDRSAVTLVSEEILLEVTSEMTKEISSESINQDVMFKRMSRNMFMNQVEIQATGNPKGREPSDPAYDLITNTFHKLAKNRDHFNKGLWVHSQPLNIPAVPPPLALRHEAGPNPPKPPQKKTPKKKEKPRTKQEPKTVPDIKIEEITEPDVYLITYDHLHLSDLATESQRVDNSREKRDEFWASVYRKREIKYWMNLHPFVFSTSVAKRCQGITVIRPSPDHMQLAVGTVSGDVIVFNTQVEPWSVVKMAIGHVMKDSIAHLAWTMDSSRLLAVKNSGSLYVWCTKGQSASKEALKIMNFPTNSKSQPFALVPLISLVAGSGDFNLRTGSLAGQVNTDDQLNAVIADFFPSFTYLTTQHTVCAGLQNGDILKLDLETVNADIVNQRAPMLLKPKIEVEVDRSHRTRQNIEAELLKQHKHPIIHMGFIGNIGKMVTVDQQAYLNVWRYDRKHLTRFDWFVPEMKYRLSMAKTVHSLVNTKGAKLSCTCILTVTASPSGNDLVFVVLFPECQPKGPHLMILVLDLLIMKLRNFRKEIEITAEDYNELLPDKKKIFSGSMSQVYGPTGSDYLFLTLNGGFHCISLNTGSEVLRVDTVSRAKAPTFPGLDARQITLSKFHQVGTLGNFGSLYAVFFEKSNTTLKVLRLEDGNQHEDSRFMSKAYEKWSGYKPTPYELRVNPVNWTLPDMKHAEAEMRNLILSLVDHNGEITIEDQAAEKIGNYKVLQTKVDIEGLLDDI